MVMLRRMPSLLLSAALLLPMFGCSSGDAPVKTNTASNSPSENGKSENPSSKSSSAKSQAKPNPRSESATRENIGFKDGNGEKLYELKFKDDGAKLVDANEQELARFTVSGQKLKVKLPDDSVAAYIVAKPDGLEIRDQTQKIELFDVKRQADGDWKLKTSDEKTLAVIKKRDYGYEIEDGNEVSLFKAKLKSGKSSLRNAKDETVLYTKDEIPILCMAAMGLEQIESLPIRAGLSAAMLLLK